MSLAYKDTIFKKKKKSNFKIYFFLFVVVSAFLYFKNHKSRLEIIDENQIAAKEACIEIYKACQLWRKHDYDANGYNDYINLPLTKLSEISFVNGKKKRLFSESLSLADIKLKQKKPYHGYYFTLAVKYRPWPVKEGTDEQDLYILARPEVQGKTGSCIFILDMNGQGYFTNTKINNEVPAWPSSKELRIKLWKEFPLLES